MDVNDDLLIRIIGSFITDKKPWARFAKCHLDGIPTVFFIPGGDHMTKRQCERVSNYCRDCDVRAECLEYGLADEHAFGFYGGVPIGTIAQRQQAAETLVELRSRTVR